MTTTTTMAATTTHPSLDGDELVTPDAPSVDGELTVADVIEGDLVFCARPGLLQNLCSRAGEPWRHVGLAVAYEGQLAISEVAGPRFGLRPLPEIVDRYEAIAVGRVADHHREAAAVAARWTAARAGQAQVYAWDDLILAGFIAVSRCYVQPDDEPALTRSLQAAASAMTRHPVGAEGVSYTCSSYVATALAEAGIDPLVDLTTSRCGPSRPSLLDLARRRRRPVRAGAGCRISSEQLISLTRALLLAAVAATTGLSGPVPLNDVRRWVTPGDLWRSGQISQRWYLTVSECRLPHFRLE